MKPTVWHPHPLRTDANDQGYVPIHGLDDEVEALPVRREGGDRAVICAAPFFVYGYSLEDEGSIDHRGLIGAILKRADTFTYPDHPRLPQGIGAGQGGAGRPGPQV